MAKHSPEFSWEKDAVSENAGAIEKMETKEKKERKNQWGKFKRLFLTGALLVGGGLAGQYEMNKAPGNVEDLKPGEKLELTLKSKDVKGKEAKFTIGRDATGYILEGTLNEGDVRVMNIGAGGKVTSPEGGLVSYVLPLEDGKEIDEALAAGDEPGQVLRELMTTAKHAKVTRLEMGDKGVRPVETIEVQPAEGKNPASITESTFDAHGKKHMRNISFQEAQVDAQNL